MEKAKLTVYSTPTCPYCKQAKEYFGEKNVEFVDVDVSQNQEKAQEMVEKSGQMGVPVIIVEKDGKEEIIIGFDKGKIDSLLGLAA